MQWANWRKKGGRQKSAATGGGHCESPSSSNNGQAVAVTSSSYLYEAASDGYPFPRFAHDEGQVFGVGHHASAAHVGSAGCVGGAASVAHPLAYVGEPPGSFHPAAGYARGSDSRGAYVGTAHNSSFSGGCPGVGSFQSITPYAQGADAGGAAVGMSHASSSSSGGPMVGSIHSPGSYAARGSDHGGPAISSPHSSPCSVGGLASTTGHAQAHARPPGNFGQSSSSPQGFAPPYHSAPQAAPHHSMPLDLADAAQARLEARDAAPPGLQPPASHPNAGTSIEPGVGAASSSTHIPPVGRKSNRLPQFGKSSKPKVGMNAVVKNTFVEAVDCSDDDDQHRSMKRAASDSDLSQSSNEEALKFWFPELSSSGSHSSRDSEQTPFGVSRRRLPLQQWQSCALSSASVRRQSGFSSEEGGLGDTADARVFDGPNVAVPGGASSSTPADVGVPESLEATREGRGRAEGPSELVLSLHEESGVAIEALEEAAATYDLSQIPRNSRGELRSVGSIQHKNDCSPCLFWFRRSCLKGVVCTYCHFRHKGQKNVRIRPSKETRRRIREALNSTRAGKDGCDSGSDEPSE